MRKTLLLFTGSYPYAVAGENTFIPQELDVLRRHFDRVILIPMAMGGARETVTLSNVEVETSYARFTQDKKRMARQAIGGLMDPTLLRELAVNAWRYLANPRHVVRAASAYALAKLTDQWIRQDAPTVSWDDCVLYTWWFDPATLGRADFARSKKVPVVTRAHGRDVYEERVTPAYLPFRKRSLMGVHVVYSASRAGAQYLSDRYPEFREKVRVGLLGTEDPGFLNEPSRDGVFRLASCSVLLPVKRVDLMIRGVAELGRMHPKQRFQWTHVGVGTLRSSLETLARSVMPDNVSWQLREYRGKDDLLHFYRSQPVDLFLNTSKSEGTPVAIMEAISVGIPVLATAVGGNPEIVTSENGVVLGADPQPREIAHGIAALMQDATRLARLRAGSRQKWEREYSATRNYTAFAETMTKL